MSCCIDCMYESDICEAPEEWECPAWDWPDACLDLEDDWEAPEWMAAI